MPITPTWDDVYISVYNFEGVNLSFPIVSASPNLQRGTVNYIGPNVDRVSIGQLVIFKQELSGYISDGTNTWAVVPQQGVLTIFTSLA